MTSLPLRDLLSTFNGWTDNTIAKATRVADECGGTVTEQYTTIAYLCRAGRD
jgi:hypothetical protein